MMTVQNKKKRLDRARRYISKGDDFWFRTVFSDEKRFTLDGTDGYNCYWHYLRCDVDLFFKRQKGGGSLMNWGAIYLYGVSEIVLVNGNMDSKAYCEVLEGGLPPFSAETFGEQATS